MKYNISLPSSQKFEHQSRMTAISRFTSVLGLVLSLALALLLASPLQANANDQFVDIFPKEQSEIQLILDTLETSITQQPEDLPRIIMMLHGSEASRFLRPNYADNKILVDQTAKLAAYGVIEVKICEKWMRGNDFTKSDLFPFVNTVPFGEGELERLSAEEGYVEYSVSM